jgi:hypothetical protein
MKEKTGLVGHLVWLSGPVFPFMLRTSHSYSAYSARRVLMRWAAWRGLTP